MAVCQHHGVRLQPRRLAKLGHHGTGFDRGELVFIAQEHQTRLIWHSFEQAGHQFQIDHRSFINHDHVGLQNRCIAAACVEQFVQGVRSVGQTRCIAVAECGTCLHHGLS